MTSITCKAPAPPTVSTNYYNTPSNVFSENIYYQANLYAPREAVDDYSGAYMWRDFTNIVGADFVDTGDLDGDGIISINDVTMVIDLIAHGGAEDIPEADINGDGVVTIADVTALIDMILY